jgi:hypothetical protein
VPAEGEAFGFLDLLWRLQVPDANGQFKGSGDIATALQKGVSELGQLLDGVQDPVRAIQFINNLMQAAVEVPSLKNDLKDAHFLRELMEFGIKFARLNPDITTSTTAEISNNAFLDVFWRNDRAAMALAESDLSEFFEVLGTSEEGLKGLEFGGKLLEMSAYIEEPTLQLYKHNNQFLTELVKLGAAYTSLNPAASTGNQSLNFFLDTAYRLNDMQTSAQELGGFLKIVTNPDAVLYANSERLKKLKVSTDEDLQNAKTSNEFIQKLMLSGFAEDSAVLYSKAEKFRVRDYGRIKPQTNPLALISIDRFIDIVEKVEAVWKDDTPQQIITRLRRLYYPGDSGWNPLKGFSQKEAFDRLLPNAPNYIEVQPPPIDYPTGPSLGSYRIERRVYKPGLDKVDKDAYAILTAKADENGKQDNPSPYIFIPGSNEMIDIGHLLLTLDALLHPGSDAPYSDPYYNVPTIDPASWVADVGVGSVWMTLQQQGTPQEGAPKNIRLDGVPIEDAIDAFYKASAPEADILGDIDGFGLFDRFNSSTRKDLPLSTQLKEYYLRSGSDIPFSVSSRWRTFANSYQAKPITATFDIDELTEINKQTWVQRIDRFNNLFGDGAIAVTTGQGRQVRDWTYTRAMFDRFVEYIQEHLNR